MTIASLTKEIVKDEDTVDILWVEAASNRDLANERGEATDKADANLATSQPCVQEPKIRE